MCQKVHFVKLSLHSGRIYGGLASTLSLKHRTLSLTPHTIPKSWQLTLFSRNLRRWIQRVGHRLQREIDFRRILQSCPL